MRQYDRWPRGTPVGPGGRGPGGGRFRGGWLGAAVRALQRPFTDAELEQREKRAATFTADSEYSTWRQYRHDGRWDADRAALHRRIVDEVWEQRGYDRVPAERLAHMVGGLAGAGKTTTLSGRVDLGSHISVNPDEMKDELVRRGLFPTVPGHEDLSPMEHSTLVHMESVHLANMLAERAYAEGRNVVIDASMGTREATEGRLRRLRESGYRVNGVFVDVPVEVSLQRSSQRYRQGMRDWLAGQGVGGRPIPPQFILGQRGEGGRTVNRQVFDQLRQFFDSWQVFDNSGPAPRLVEES